MKKRKKVKSLKRKYECHSCGQIFLQLYRMIQHFKSTMCYLYSSVEVGKNCPTGRHTKTKQNGLILDNHSNLKKATCYICQKRFISENAVNRHLKKVHESYQCYKCPNAIFYTRAEITSHLFSLHEEEFTLYGCDNCVDIYDIPNSIIIHLKPKLINCTICNKLFFTLHRLEQHNKWHNGINHFTCEYCPKTFTTLSNFILHEHEHTGEKPSSCIFCYKWFSPVTNINIYIKNRGIDQLMEKVKQINKDLHNN